MKALIIFLFCFLQIFVLKAQPRVSRFREINDTVIVKYNRGDYQGIYLMGNHVYKDLNSEGELTGGLDHMKKNFGKVLSSELMDDMGDIKHFKWTCEKGNMRFELWLDGGTVQQFKFGDLVRQSDALSRRVPTDNPLKTQLDSLVDKYAAIYMSSPKAVGFSIGIYRTGKKFIYSYGEMEKGSARPVTDQTIFTDGSITKTFTGVLLARAVTEKKVKPDDDIRKYLNGRFPNLEYQGHPITLLELANHTSGINKFRFNIVPASADNWTPEVWMRYFDTYTLDSLYRDLHVLKVDTMPGTHYHYSLIGTILLNLALQKIYHQSIDQIVRGYYGHSFHMKDTKLASDPGDMPRYAQGYDEKGQLQPQMPHYTVTLSTIHSTMRDMMNYVEVNVREKNPVIRLAHQLTWGDLKTFAVGYTWDIEQYYGKYKMIWYSGYDYGSITLCTGYPELNLGMFLWANDDSRQGNLYDMERGIRETLLYWDLSN